MFTQLPEYHRGNKKKQTNRIVKMAEGERVLPRGKNMNIVYWISC